MTKFLRHFRCLAVGLVVMVGTAGALAAAAPTPSTYDPRIKTVVYNPRDVVPIRFRLGESMLIQFEADEVIEGEPAGLGMGDTKAWTLQVRGNNIFFKAKAVMPSTNLIVVTNKRRYAFDLQEIKSAAPHKGRTVDPEEPSTYILDFIYPDSTAKRDAQQAAADRLAATIAEAKKQTGPFNTAYFMRGDVSLAPTEARDNGRFTYFRYATSRDLPEFFRVLSDGSEMLVNRHIEGDTVVIHETAAKFHLRSGTAVLAIENEGYSPDGQFNETGTTLRNIVRVLKGEKK